MPVTLTHRMVTQILLCYEHPALGSHVVFRDSNRFQQNAAFNLCLRHINLCFFLKKNYLVPLHDRGGQSPNTAWLGQEQPLSKNLNFLGWGSKSSSCSSSFCRVEIAGCDISVGQPFSDSCQCFPFVFWSSWDEQGIRLALRKGKSHLLSMSSFTTGSSNLSNPQPD